VAVSNAAHPIAVEGGHGVTLARARHAIRTLLRNLGRTIAIVLRSGPLRPQRTRIAGVRRVDRDQLAGQPHDLGRCWRPGDLAGRAGGM
jgi:hypothetical protein